MTTDKLKMLSTEVSPKSKRVAEWILVEHPSEVEPTLESFERDWLECRLDPVVILRMWARLQSPESRFQEEVFHQYLEDVDWKSVVQVLQTYAEIPACGFVRVNHELCYRACGGVVFDRHQLANLLEFMTE